MSITRCRVHFDEPGSQRRQRRSVRLGHTPADGLLRVLSAAATYAGSRRDPTEQASAFDRDSPRLTPATPVSHRNLLVIPVLGPHGVDVTAWAAAAVPASIRASWTTSSAAPHHWPGKKLQRRGVPIEEAFEKLGRYGAVRAGIVPVHHRRDAGRGVLSRAIRRKWWFFGNPKKRLS